MDSERAMTRLPDDLGALSPSESAMAAARIPDRLAMAENDQPLADPDAALRAYLDAEDVRMGNYGARIADDCFCKGCGRRGVVGLCSACERS